MKNLKQLLGICEHIWNILEKVSLVDEFNDCVGTKYILQCEKCRKIQSKKT